MLDLSSQHLGDRVRRIIVILGYLGNNTYIHIYEEESMTQGRRYMLKTSHLKDKLSLRAGRNVKIISDEGKRRRCQISHTYFLPEDSEETLAAHSTMEDMCVWRCPCLIRMFSTDNTVDRPARSRTDTLTSSSVSNAWCKMPSKGCLVRLSNESVKIHKILTTRVI